jgi:tetratricopeptide (TPR) repeat protein
VTGSSRLIPRFLAALALAAFALAAPGLTLAQEAAPGAIPQRAGQPDVVALRGEAKSGFGRLVFDWPRPVAFEASVADGIVVIKFARPLRFAETDQRLPLTDYIALVRQDEDLRTLRLPLRQPVRLHTSTSGNLVAIDLVPEDTEGDPPDIVDDRVKETDNGRSVLSVRLRMRAEADRTRIVLDWPQEVGFEQTAKSGETTLVFDKPAKIDVKRLNDAPPAWVRSAQVSPDDTRTLFILAHDPDSKVETAREGNRITIDVLAPAGDAEGPRVILPEQIAKAGETPETPVPERKPDGEDAQSEAGHGETPAGVDKKPEEKSPEEKPGEAHAGKTDEAVAHAAAKPDEHAQPDEAAHPESGHGEAKAEQAARAAEPGQPVPEFEFAAERSRGDVILSLPLASSRGLAVLRRGETAYVLMDGAAAIDPEAILKAAKDLVADPALIEAGGMSVLKIGLLKPLAIGASAAGGRWTVTLGTQSAEPPLPVVLLRDARTVGPGRVRAAIKHVTRIAEFNEPETGERMLVALAAKEPQGLIAARDYVDFDAPATAQGLVIIPSTDGLKLVRRDDGVVIDAPGGLTLSAGTVAQYAPEREPLGDPAIPAAMDFAAWAGAGEYRDEKARRLTAIGAEGEGGTAARADLARFYLARDLGAEAIGALDVMLQDDEGFINDPAFRALRGTANLMMGRYRNAAEDLQAGGLADDPHAALLLGLALHGLGRMPEARAEFERGETAIRRFTPLWQGRFLAAGAEAALETNAVDMTDRFLGAMPDEGAAKADLTRAIFVRARLAERLKQDERALRLYRETIATDYRPFYVPARLGEIGLMQKSGEMKTADAILALDQLRWRWRGDETELNVLQKLGRMQIAAGDYRNGLQTMRSAVLGFPGLDSTRRVQGEMNEVFAALFIDGKADALPPIQALGLYYDFKELTPIGAMGDDMVRRLADRLIAVDLLEQAAELLAHQVDRRLDGVAKAQIAARLAAVYLMNREPEKALTALRSSGLTRLPDDIALQRRLLTARALSDLKKPEAALEAIELDEVPEANRLRADVLWAATQWPEAGKALEVLLAGLDSIDALSDVARLDVMRLAIAYTMADDAKGLASVRTRFSGKMKGSAQEAAFAAVTKAIDPSGVALRDAAKAIAATDTLDAFLTSLGLGRPETPSPGQQASAQ